MVLCPECNADLQGHPQECYICGCDLSADDTWTVLGTVDSKMWGDFVKETLRSCNIPAVVISKSGFFGNVGLLLSSFYKPREFTYEISVPNSLRSEAVNVLDMTLKGKWKRKDA